MSVFPAPVVTGISMTAQQLTTIRAALTHWQAHIKSNFRDERAQGYEEMAKAISAQPDCFVIHGSLTVDPMTAGEIDALLNGSILRESRLAYEGLRP